MKRFFLFAAVLLNSLTLLAQPRLLASSIMNVSEARYDFEGLDTASVALATDNDTEPTDIILNYADTTVFLNIYDASPNEYGCTVYSANVQNSEEDNQYRFHIRLESDVGCEHLNRPWTASVRKGYGFCGTMDSTMELSGYPEAK